MKKYDLPCNVIIDLLPLYNEGICSDESREIIEEHLKECENCSRYSCQRGYPKTKRD